MTNYHLLIYRLAELMLERQQHILALDDLFEDEQIGAFVRSIQIDSPYQQLIFEGVLTETIKEERVMVTFTVEGYFHYVLGEVIEQQTEGKGAEALKEFKSVCESEKEKQIKDRNPWPFCNAAICNFGTYDIFTSMHLSSLDLFCFLILLVNII